MTDDHHMLKALIDGVDEIARRMEGKWGMGRLPLLVSTDTRAKFYAAGEKFNEALQACYGGKVITRDMLDHVKAKGAVMERAWAALDAQAEAADHKAQDPDVWETVLSDGSILAVVQTNADASKVLRDGRNTNVWTMDEIAKAVEAFPDVVRSMKDAFGDVKVSAVRERRSRGVFEPCNEVPF